MSEDDSTRTFGMGLPVSSSGLWEQAQPWMAKRSGHAVNGGPEGRRERPARGYGQPRPTQDADSPEHDRLKPAPLRQHQAWKAG